MKSPKRFLEALLPFASILASSYNIYQTYRLQNHVEQLQSKFEEFAMRTVSFQKSVTLFEKDVVHVLSKLSDQVQDVTNELHCATQELVKKTCTFYTKKLKCKLKLI